MRPSQHLALVLLVCPALALTPGAQTNDETEIRAIIEEIDQLYRSESSYSELEMEVVTPHWQRTLAMEAWSLGLDRTFIRITSPKKERGVATLRVESEMWNYLPKTDKVIKIPPSMMMSSWMGSDFTNDDLVKEFSLFEDYTYEFVTVEAPDDNLIYINCIPREDLPVVWGNVVIAARRGDHLPVWQKYYDEKGALVRVLHYRDIREMGGRTLPAVMEMVPQRKEGHRTLIRYTRVEFDAQFEEEIFSLRHLRSQR
ncbi:MAG TPA: outer membrane lipoprotein-sorting protein [Acidobacteriota bacterium]|nr:outer membrane lipoprotein-sorting protein [Acidobacteriota bacterium]